MKWYFSYNCKPLGPISTEELLHKVQQGIVGPNDLICLDSEGEWNPAVSYRTYIKPQMFPAFQMLESENSLWVVLRMTSEQSPVQDGPFSTQDIQKKLLQRKINYKDFIWKTGMTGWACIQDRIEFSLQVRQQQQEGVFK